MITLTSFDRSSLYPLIFDSLLSDKSKTHFIHRNEKQTSCKILFLEGEVFVFDSLDIRDSTKKFQTDDVTQQRPVCCF